MRISDWSSDVCSSDLQPLLHTPDGDEDWICKIIHTSGTTSRPKGVQLSTQAVGAVLASLRQRMPADAHRRYLSLVPLSLLLEQEIGRASCRERVWKQV